MKLSDHNFRKSLPNEFYLQPTVTVAQELLGKCLVVNKGGMVLGVVINEVEAYLSDDPASHSFRGPTQRNRSMFECGGTCYIYLSYGIHYCMNVVTGAKGVGEAVLIRGGVPMTGTEKLCQNRSTTDLRKLLNGPGKITQALGIDLSFDGIRIGSQQLGIFNIGCGPSRSKLLSSVRIGISKAREKLLRFYYEETGNGF